MLVPGVTFAEQLELLQITTTEPEICKEVLSSNSIPNEKIQVVSAGVINITADDADEFHFVRSIKGAEISLKGRLKSQTGNFQHKVLQVALVVLRETGASIKTSTNILVPSKTPVLISGTCGFNEETSNSVFELWFVKLTK